MSLSRRQRDVVEGYGFLLPNILGFAMFVLLPVGMSLVLSLCEWDLFGKPLFVGLKNFRILLYEFHPERYKALSGLDALGFWNYMGDRYFWQFLGNTLFFMLMIPASMAVSLALAVTMNRKLRGIVVFRTIYFLPVISSMVACAILWRWIYNPEYGLLNGVLAGLSIPRDSLPQWLNSTAWAKPAIMLMLIWKGAGYNMLLYLAGLQGIPPSLYEAAEVDGANSWNQFWHVTFPMLGHVNLFIVIMSVIGGLQMFGEIFVMTGGGPGGSTTTLVYYIYQNAFVWNRMGMAASLSWILFVMIFTVTAVQWRYLGKRAAI